MQQKHSKPQIVFNYQFLIFVGVCIVCASGAVAFFQANDRELGFLLLGIALFLALGVFVTPLYFCFSKEHCKIVWLLPFVRIIPWNAIYRIIELKWGEVHRDLPKYEIFYHFNYKGCIIDKQFDIPKTKRIQKAISRYAWGKIL